jgi:hypothetical protein
MTPFDLLLFSTDPAAIRPAAAAGVAGFIVDWEWIGKEERQTAADTEVNRDTVEDLRRARAATRARLLCRLNAVGETTEREIEEAIGAGADELLIPMVRAPREVEGVLARVGGRCGVGILVETVAAVREAAALARLPLSRVYVGLNDLAIERRTSHIFAPLADGLLDRIRDAFGVPFGFGGLTLPERGHPVPCRLLIAEMARLRTDFSFLRRSFRRDMAGRDPAVEVPRLAAALDAARRRTPVEVAADREELLAVLAAGRVPSLGKEPPGVPA